MSAYSAILSRPRDWLTAAPEPDASAQFRERALTVDAGARVVFSTGATYEPVAGFNGLDAAWQALKSAKGAVQFFNGETA